jgi:mRNA-degrading endonuclease toxin of MazEF toxin-antitoxin module
MVNMKGPVRRGEVYWANLDPAIGTEIKKTRPALVVSPDDMNAALPSVIVAPITSKGQALGSRPAFFSIKRPTLFTDGDGSKTTGIVQRDQSCQIGNQRGSINAIELATGPGDLNRLSACERHRLDVGFFHRFAPRSACGCMINSRLDTIPALASAISVASAWPFVYRVATSMYTLKPGPSRCTCAGG